MKKPIVILLLAALFCNLLTPVAAAASQFPDVPEDAWYGEDVTFAVKHGWINGFPDGSFGPSAPLTRAMFVTMLYRQAGSPATTASAQPFEDVDSGAYYAAAVRWASAAGVTTGVDDTHFSPNSTVTREQVATMLYRYANSMGVPTGPVRRPIYPFTDEEDCADYALDALRWVKQTGIVEGYPDGSFLPKQAVKRSECVKLLCAIFDQLPISQPGAVRELTQWLTKPQTDPWAPWTASPDEEARAAVLSFCTELTRRSLTTEKNEVFSPVSVLYALGMTANGAKGETLSQLEDAFGVSLDRLNEYLRVCGQRLNVDTETNKVHLADSIWINENSGFTCAPEYLQTLVDFYNAQAFSGAFDQRLCDRLNEWISENTYGMIPRMLDTADPDAALYLVNTLALKLRWSDKYYTTFPGVFTTASGAQQDCRMIPGSEHWYLHDEDTVGFIKAYDCGYRFVALLPGEGISVQDYLAELSGDKLQNLLDTAETDCRVVSRTPEFSADSSFQLTAPLRELGVTDLFDPSAADLSGIGGDGLFVSGVMQKAHLKLDKDGTEAAAATIIPVAGTAAPPEKRYEVTLDRPFVYIILDDLSDLPLFVGVTTSVGD